MTSSSEVIAIEGAGDKRGSSNFGFKTNFKPKKQFKHYPYFVDPSIVPRVKQYLEDNKDKVYVDIDEMVSELQRKYRDYGKRKRSVFKGLVEKAFSVVLKTYNISDHDTSRDGDEADSSSVSDMDVDSEDVDLIVEPNTSNNQVMNMYMQQQCLKKMNANTGAANEGTKELIDISSDDEEEEAPAKRSKHSDSTNSTPKATNGQATPKEVAVCEETVPDAPNNAADPSIEASPTSANPVLSATTPDIERSKRKRVNVNGGSAQTPVSSSGNVSRRKRREVSVLRPTCTFKDIGGCSNVLQEVCKLLVHLRHPEIFKQIGVTPPRGFLLHGPPGCGKSLLANAIAGEFDVPLLKVAATELVAGVSGESEERIRDLFDQAVSIAPCVLFIDEIDAITPNRNNAQREMERRIVAQLLTTIDELGEKEGGNEVLVVGATNRPDSLDPALRRAGRFDREVCMGIPDREARVHILRVVCSSLALAPDVSSDAGIEELASLTPGYVGADLAALTREAAMVAVNRIFADIQKKEAVNLADKLPTENTESEKQEQEQGQAQLQNNVELKVNSENALASTPEVSSGQEAMDCDNNVVTPSEICSNVTQASEEAINPEGEKQADIASSETVEGQNEVTVEHSTISNTCEVEMPDGEPNLPKENVEEPPADLPAQDVEILCPKDQEVSASSTEIGQNEKKTDDDVEVLEMETVPNHQNNSSDQTPNTTEELSKDENCSQEMVLSQKLLPPSNWSPELCQLMSWLKEVPPLTAAQLSELTITMSDFHEALRHVQPSAKREGFATVPDVTWDDVGSLANVRAELQLSVLAPVRYSKQFSLLGLNAPAGVLLCGPPGCGKTLLAKAVANEAGINFISVKGPELLNMYVGESERAVRQVFQRARNSAPCVIFFDELDALCPRRSDAGDSGVSSRVVNQLLTEMDGVESRTAVFLMAASNRPDIIDPAVLRPGRLDKIVYVGLPNADDRADILRALTKKGTKPLLASDIDIREIAKRPQLEGYSGADLAALVREAGVEALREFIGSGGVPQDSPLCVSLKHFNMAIEKIRPSVSGKARAHYEKLQKLYSNCPVEPENKISN